MPPTLKGRARAGEFLLEPPEHAGRLTLALKPDRVLASRDTGFQRLEVVEAGPLGRVMLLDGCIQVSEADERGYHEMLAHVPMMTHPEPQNVLIIGGGDGGALREVLRHESVERAVLCEIDAGVVEAAKEFFPTLASGFSDPRAEVLIADGVKHLAGLANAYDVILVDSSDPEGPARVLFEKPFFQSLQRALAPGGVVVGLAEYYVFFPRLLKSIFPLLRGLFPLCRYYLSRVPSYIGGEMGFYLASDGPDPLAGPASARLAALGRLDYYNPDAHRAAFALPNNCLRLLAGE